METRERLEVERALWLKLVRAACVTQSAGYPGAITVSKRFNEEVTAFELGQLARTATRLAEEYDLAAEPCQNGCTLSVRISAEKPATKELSHSPANLPEERTEESHHVPMLLRFLRRGHVDTSREVGL